jgi:hypothetical protein
MRLSRRLTGVLLVLAVAGALAPSALAKRNPPPTSPAQVAPGSISTSMVDIEALR